MKVVDVSEFYAEQGGGVRTYTNQKLAAAAALGHELVVVAPGARDGEEARHGGRVRWVKGPPMPFDPRYHLFHKESVVHRILAEEAPDLVEGSSVWSGGWIAGRYTGPARKVLVYHQDPIAAYGHTFLDRRLSPASIDAAAAPYWAYLRWLARHYDATVVSGEWLAERLRDHGVGRTLVVPFGVDGRSFQLADEAGRHAQRRRWRELAGVGDDALLLVTISRFHPEKRLGTLFDAYAAARTRLQAQGRSVGWLIFGSGPLEERYRRRAAQTPGIHFHGFVSDRRELATALDASDVFFHGSAAETYGIVLAEALCAGLPLVVPDRGGARELAGSDWAEVYEPGNADGAANALLRLVARDPATLRSAARAAAAQRVLDPSEHFRRLYAGYEQLIAERR